MPLYKRKDSPNWWVKLAVKGQKPIQCSTGTTDKQLAYEYEAKLKSELWLQTRLGIKPKHYWEEAVVRYLDETAHNKSRESDIIHFRWLDKHLSGKYLNDFNRTLIERITSIRKNEGVSNATVNRCVGLVSRVLHRAANDWEWIDKPVKVRKLPEPKKRVRFLLAEEAKRLISVLPEHLVPLVRFSLATGLRKSNVTGLTWSQISLDRKTAWIHADQTKNGEPLAVPLSSEALEVLRAERFKHQTHVFTYKGEPIEEPAGKAWRAALKRAEITDFRWHDLRHTWASWHVQKGTPLAVLQELGGWSDLKMVLKYAHLSSNHLAAYVDNVSVMKETGKDDVATNEQRHG
ncbi:MAG: tyrosine-type recombinase/integrase [Methylophilaceae bacterium]